MDGEGTSDELAPLIFVSVPVSALTGEEQRSVPAWGELAATAVLDAARDAKEPWTPRIYSCLEWTKKSSPEDDVFARNTKAMTEDADAMIALAFHGGSTGVGYELCLACSHGLSILYLLPTDEPASRLVAGLSREYGVTIARVDASGVRSCVQEWLTTHRAAIEGHKRRRSNWHLELLRLHAAIVEVWASLDDVERKEVIGVSRLTESRIERLVMNLAMFASATFQEVVALTGALHLDVADGFRPERLPVLSVRQRQALADAARSYGWGGAETLDLETLAALEMSRSESRWSLTTKESWKELSDAYHPE